jgi:uncharacterized protein involved in outer membrane biogenesis
VNRSQWIVVIVLGGALVFAGALVFITRSAGGVPNWVARQAVAIANAYLDPELAYRDLRYTPPFEVSLLDATLTARDGTRVVEIEELRLKLAELPAVGKPIVIEQLVLRRPVVRLVRTEAGWKGLRPLLEGDRGASAPSELRLSNVLQLRRVAIEDGSVRYEGAGAAPITLDAISLELGVGPEDARGAGWYAIDVAAGRKPALATTARGAFNIDTFDLDIAEGTASVSLDRQGAASLPEDLRKLLTDADAGGVATARFSGRVPGLDPLRAEARADLRVDDFSVARGTRRFPMKTLELAAGLAGGVLTVERLTASPLGGKLEGRGRVRLAETGRPTDAEVRATDVDLSMIQRDPSARALPTTLVGIASLDVRASASLDDWRGSVSGAGSMSVRDGRLLVLPGTLAVLEQLQIAVPSGVASATDHWMNAEFELGPGAARVTRSEVHTAVASARGTGTVGYDGALDLRVNAGPLEKAQSALGKVGELFGRLTDRLMAYRIRGTVDEPEVSIEGPG